MSERRIEATPPRNNLSVPVFTDAGHSSHLPLNAYECQVSEAVEDGNVTFERELIPSSMPIEKMAALRRIWLTELRDDCCKLTFDRFVQISLELVYRLVEGSLYVGE